MSAKIYIGTSGWNYLDWRGKFYPQNLPASKWLDFYSQNFQTVEVNYSFYQLPQVQTFARWAEQTPADFLFALKVSRFITHIKRLVGIKRAWQKFLTGAKILGDKLGPILFQLPPSFKINLQILDKFFQETADSHLRLAFEFRHPSWFVSDTYQLLKKNKAALVIAHSKRYPQDEVITAPFLYLRFHGPDSLFASSYSLKELKKWAQKIKIWAKKTKEIYVYFNNDFSGYAVKNAKSLRNLVIK